MKIVISRATEKMLAEAITELNIINSKEAPHSGAVENLNFDKIDGGYVAKINSKVVAWGAAWNKTKQYHIFVSKDHRGKKIGNNLLKLKQRNFPSHLVCPWNSNSGRFFKREGLKTWFDT